MAITKGEVKDQATSDALQRLENDFETRTPYSQYEYQDITFPSTVDQDIIISTRLRPSDPEAIFYEIVDWKLLVTPPVVPIIYRDISSTRKPWGSGYVVLRCNIASAMVKIRLFTT